MTTCSAGDTGANAWSLRHSYHGSTGLVLLVLVLVLVPAGSVSHRKFGMGTPWIYLPVDGCVSRLGDAGASGAADSAPKVLPYPGTTTTGSTVVVR
jgi:hypothetical protein